MTNRLVEVTAGTFAPCFCWTQTNDATLEQGTIAGSFGNLSDGGILTVGSNTLQANYEGGDGNDLTLTVVP